MVRVKLARTKESFFVKIESKDPGTVRNYVTAINNLENFCMEQFGKVDYVAELKDFDNEEVFDFLQAWINWNSQISPRAVGNYFSRIKKIKKF